MTADSISASYAVGTVVRTNATANFRPCASTASRCSPYGQLTSGTRATLTAGSPSNGFYEVDLARDVGGHTHGFIHGNLLSIVSIPSPTPPPADMRDTATALVDATQDCTPVSGSPRYAKDSGGTRNIPICRTRTAIWFRADLDIDCDGGSSSSCRSDPYYQSSTSAVTSTGRYLDASTMNFAVVPLDTDGFSFSRIGVRSGTVMAAVYAGRVSYGIVGDMGPRGVVGEASAHMAGELGINTSPTRGGVESGVTYLLFPDIRVTRNEDQAEARRLAEAAVSRFLGR